MYMQFDNGDLIGRSKRINEALDDYGFWFTFHQILEDYYCNGSYAPFNAGDGNPYVGLTDAPCIAEDLDIHEDGRREIIGRFWYYGDYMINCPLETLASTGSVIFSLFR